MGFSTSHNLMGLYGLLQGYLYLFYYGNNTGSLRRRHVADMPIQISIGGPEQCFIYAA
jgi:hypothetical protein